MKWQAESHQYSGYVYTFKMHKRYISMTKQDCDKLWRLDELKGPLSQNSFVYVARMHRYEVQTEQYGQSNIRNFHAIFGGRQKTKSWCLEKTKFSQLDVYTSQTLDRVIDTIFDFYYVMLLDPPLSNISALLMGSPILHSEKLH